MPTRTAPPESSRAEPLPIADFVAAMLVEAWPGPLGSPSEAAEKAGEAVVVLKGSTDGTRH
jgi:hypothetical protein